MQTQRSTEHAMTWLLPTEQRETTCNDLAVTEHAMTLLRPREHRETKHNRPNGAQNMQ